MTLADILLQKLQIWEINDKDLKDIEYLFTVAEIGDDDTKKINQATSPSASPTTGASGTRRTTNLGRVKEHVDKVDALSAEQKAKVKQVADQVLARIDAEPKTKGWNKRAKKGTNKIWYNTELLRLVIAPPAPPSRPPKPTAAVNARAGAHGAPALWRMRRAGGSERSGRPLSAGPRLRRLLPPSPTRLGALDLG